MDDRIFDKWVNFSFIPRIREKDSRTLLILDEQGSHLRRGPLTLI